MTEGGPARFKAALIFPQESLDFSAVWGGGVPGVDRPVANGVAGGELP